MNSCSALVTIKREAFSTFMGSGRRALVLSAGGMFGAYQAGAWKALSEFFQPDVVAGASIGSLNGWAIAGGCSPDRWVDYWLSLDRGSQHRFRIPKSPLDGVMDPGPFQEWVREIHGSFSPRIPCGVVVTDLLRLEPRLVLAPQVEWKHLAASCAVFGLLPQPRINGRVFTDGGLLGALPLWAGPRMGADKIIAINVFQAAPIAMRTFLGGLRRISGKVPAVPNDVQVATLGPKQPLGSLKDAIYWKKDNIRNWIAQGYEDVVRQKHSLLDMF